MHTQFLRNERQHQINQAAVQFYRLRREEKFSQAKSYLRATVRYGQNRTIFLEGEPAEYVYQIVTGTVRLSRTFRDGTRCIVAFYHPGDFFGWTNGALHLFSAEAAAPTRLLLLKRDALLEADKDPRQLLETVTREFHRVQEHALLLKKPARNRVATFLLEIWRVSGKPKYLQFPMRHTDVADYLGITLETLSRTLTELARCGLVARLSRGRLELHNTETLARMADSASAAFDKTQ